MSRPPTMDELWLGGPADFQRVPATEGEKAAWHAKHPRQEPPWRVECRACGKRIWNSGLGLGAHRRACKGTKKWWQEGKVHRV